MNADILSRQCIGVTAVRDVPQKGTVYVGSDMTSLGNTLATIHWQPNATDARLILQSNDSESSNSISYTVPGPEKSSPPRIRRKLVQKDGRHSYNDTDTRLWGKKALRVADDSLKGDNGLIQTRVHHRCIVLPTARHLQCFNSSKEFMQATRDAFVAHQLAYERCGTIHGDVSGNNVRITDDGCGVLYGWDLARKVTDRADVKTGEVPPRIGTCNYMSANLLRIPNKKYVLQDDLEAFVNLVLYYGLRFMKHVASDIEIAVGFCYEDLRLGPGGLPMWGVDKAWFFRTVMRSPGFRVFTREPMHTWHRWVSSAVSQWQSYEKCTLGLESGDFPHERKLIDAKRNLWWPPTAEEIAEGYKHLSLTDHTNLLNQWDIALAQPCWPENDEAYDNVGPLMAY